MSSPAQNASPVSVITATCFGARPFELLVMDPNVIDRCEQLGDLVNGIRSVIDGSVAVYHHSLATETHLEWVSDTFT